MTMAERAAADRRSRRAPDSSDSLGGATHLIGELQSDGLASLRPVIVAEPTSINGEANDESPSSLAGNHKPLATRNSITANILRAANSLERKSSSGSTASEYSMETPSEEDYDAAKHEAATIAPDSKGAGIENEPKSIGIRKKHSMPGGVEMEQFEDIKVMSSVKQPSLERRKSIPIVLEKTDVKGRYRLTADDSELREILRQGLQFEAKTKDGKRRSKFSDLVFTRQFTAFDRQNPASSASPFHGFFTLFWLATALMIIKIAAQNWKEFGSVFGRNEILQIMFNRDVIVLGLTDGVMCAATSFGLFLQLIISKGLISWNREGWIIQHVWQSMYLGVIILWTIHRDWPWTHTVFIVLHCLVMLMKQHSYAFYNGYLSELFKRRAILRRKLKDLDHLEPTSSPAVSKPPETVLNSSPGGSPSSVRSRNKPRRRQSIANTDAAILHEDTEVANVASAIASGAPLDLDQIQAYQRIISWELEDLSQELEGKSTNGANQYPKNLTVKNWAEYVVLPTLVYELEYPRQDHINWYYVLEKLLATFGSIGVMIVVSQAYIYPVVMRTVYMREQGFTLSERLHEFPWVISDLLFPFMMEYMLSWYVIWECILNLLAELTRFADRGFYGDWWNTVSWDQFAKDWNRPVHAFLLRHVYHSSISALRLSRGTATLITFFLSACVHELVMWCIFKKLRGYLMAMQMMQLPLVMLSRTRMMKGRELLGNVVFWLGIFTGPSFLCSLYLII